jgi:hypothetical protein
MEALTELKAIGARAVVVAYLSHLTLCSTNLPPSHR